MVELATLTGAIIVALGHEQAGLFSNDDGAVQQAARRGRRRSARSCGACRSGKATTSTIKSDIADMKNVGRGREAGGHRRRRVPAALRQDDVPWAHLDIAGMAWTNTDLPLAPKGATGYGVRLLDQLVAERYEPLGPA